LFASLSTKALRKLKRQCKSRGKDFEGLTAKRKHDRASLRKEVLSKVLKSCKGIRP
jgi:uncharacterized protein YnzC (UPF0291/DUF896 family)